MKKFRTDLEYTDRQTKADYVYDKYGDLLKGNVLDVGADAMHLKPHIVQNGGEYVGIGFGEGIDMEFDLESRRLPFEDDSFDTVLCLDVLEHLESIHSVFAELCRVSGRHIIISLPNPWASFFNVLYRGDYSEDTSIKHYGLPVEPPEDRHRWFFREEEARKFLKYNAEKNGFRIVQMDCRNENRPMGGRGLKATIGRWMLKILFRSDIDKLSLNHGTLWCVLKKESQ